MKEKEKKPVAREFVVGNTTIAPGVVEMIVSLAAAEVSGVAGVGNAGPISAITAAFSAGKAIPTGGIKLVKNDEGKVEVEIALQAFYGYRLVEVAEDVRGAIADALKGQIGVDTASVDVHIDALAFEE